MADETVIRRIDLSDLLDGGAEDNFGSLTQVSVDELVSKMEAEEKEGE